MQVEVIIRMVPQCVVADVDVDAVAVADVDVVANARNATAKVTVCLKENRKLFSFGRIS